MKTAVESITSSSRRFGAVHGLEWSAKARVGASTVATG